MVPVCLQLVSAGGLVYYLSDAEQHIKELDRQRDILIQLQKAASTGSQLIFTVRELPAGGNNASTLARLEQIQVQLKDDKSFEIAAGDLVCGPEVSVQVAALRDSILRLIDKTKIYLHQNGDKNARHITFMRSELFATGIAFQNLSESIVALEKSARDVEPVTLSAVQNNIRTALFVIIALASTTTLGFVYLFAFDLVKRLKRLSLNMQSLALDKDLLELDSGHDEIAQLDQALHDTSAFIKNARKQQLVVLDNAAEIICAVDTRLKIININPAVQRLWHFEPDNLVGKSLVSLCPDIKSKFESIKLKDFDGEFESDVNCGDGVLRHFSWSVSWSSDDHTYACIARDVTAARQAERLRHNFIAVLSHDLRTPITSIGVGLSLLRSGARGPVPAPIEQSLNAIDTRVQGLVGLIGALLELDRLESGHLNFASDSIHAYNLLARAKDNVQRYASARGIKLVGPDSDAFVVGDSERLVDAITGLLRYCIGRSRSGDSVSLTVQQTPDFVEIAIIDRGQSIALAEQQILFERYSASKSEDGADPLANLSLCIARAVIQNHGGDLTVASSTNTATRFSIKLPTGAALAGEEEDF